MDPNSRHPFAPTLPNPDELDAIHRAMITKRITDERARRASAEALLRGYGAGNADPSPAAGPGIGAGGIAPSMTRPDDAVARQRYQQQKQFAETRPPVPWAKRLSMATGIL